MACFFQNVAWKITYLRWFLAIFFRTDIISSEYLPSIRGLVEKWIWFLTNVLWEVCVCVCDVIGGSNQSYYCISHFLCATFGAHLSCAPCAPNLAHKVAHTARLGHVGFKGLYRGFKGFNLFSRFETWIFEILVPNSLSGPIFSPFGPFWNFDDVIIPME